MLKNKARLIIITATAVIIISFFISNNPKEKNQPNVILIVIDSLRPDHLGCYGYKRDTSPSIDNLAKEGVIFTQAICQIPDTLSSVSSFLTSTYPSMHYRDYERRCNYLNPSTYTLAKILKNDGYHSGLITDYQARNYISRIKGIKDDFDTYSETSPDNPKGLTETALNWLRNNKGRRFFLYLHYFGSHAPYSSSLPYGDRCIDDNYNNIDKQISIAKEDIDCLGFIPKYVAEKGITDVKYYIYKYDNKIRIVDDQIGRLSEGIKKLGLDNRTLIILMADHGESLGEHNLYFQHSYALYDELIKVPLIVRYPAIIPQNKIINFQVQLIDVVPTILCILGIRENDYQYMEGISLIPYMLDKKIHASRHAFGRGHSGIKYFIRTENWKLIYENYEKAQLIYPSRNLPVILKKKKNFPIVYELYNLKEDPCELTNLVDVEKDTFLFLKHELDEYMIKAEKQADEARESASKYLGTDAIKPLDKEATEKLKSLGYIQ